MTDTVRVYLNGRAVDAPSGATALDAVRLVDAAEGERVAAGERLVSDSRGIVVANDAPLYLGAIFRTVSARQQGGAAPA